jgi:Trk K+ transport system NAD-binding subunit
MGRVGRGAYDAVQEMYPGRVIGLERDPATVRTNEEAGRAVILGDAGDPTFWERAEKGSVQIALLAMDDHAANLHAAGQIAARRKEQDEILVAATARFADEVKELEESGVDVVFDFFSQAGAGFAEHTARALEERKAPE